MQRTHSTTGWRKYLPSYGSPTAAPEPGTMAAAEAYRQHQQELQRDAFRREEVRREELRHEMRQELRQEVRHEELARELRLQRRRSLTTGLLLMLALGVVLAIFFTHNLTDPRSLGTQLDDAVSNVKNAGSEAGQKLADSQNAVVQASQGAAENVSTSLTDAAITAKVKTALIADPALKASKIDVTTTDGVVRLVGPAPDANAKQRATVLASAPEGVRGVDNQLVAAQPGQVVAVNGGAAQGSPSVAPAQQPPKR